LGNYETVKAITDNIRTVLKAEGINFSHTPYDDGKNIPASLMPLGTVNYTGETFEYTHGQRPGYSEADFEIKVVVSERDQVVMTREQQRWVHAIRSVLTVDALNNGGLQDSLYVSRVVSRSVTVEKREYISTITYGLTVRYREA